MDRLQVRKHRFHLQAGDRRDQVHPVGADVGDGAQLAALLHQNAPVVVGVVVEPVLGVAAVDVVDFAHVAAAHHVAGFEVERVEADVVADGRRQLSCPWPAPPARPTPSSSSPAVSRTGRACRPAAPSWPAGNAARWERPDERRERPCRPAPHRCSCTLSAGRASAGRGRFPVIDAEDAGDRHAQPPQRLDVDGADEAGADHRRSDLMQHDVVSLGNHMYDLRCMMNDE